jgi:Flp pilus assembly pilin Flp
MKNALVRLWRDEAGAETAEWLVIAGLLVAVAIAVYQGVLQGSLETAAGNIGTTIEGLPGGGGP